MHPRVCTYSKLTHSKRLTLTGLCVIHNRSLERYSCMATISRQPGYTQGVNLTGDLTGVYAWLVVYH